MNLSELADHYDLAPPLEAFPLPRTGQSNDSVGLRTGAGAFVWKRYADTHPTAALDYELGLLARLAHAGLSLAVPAPLPTRQGALWAATGAGRASLTPLLPGRTLDSQARGAVDPAEVGLYGAALGETYAALARLPAAPRPGRSLFADLFRFPPPDLDPLTLQPERIGLESDGKTAETFGWWRAEAARLRAFAEGPYRGLPAQLCHNDMSPSNVLVSEGRVSAVLDFEFATLGPRAVDLAMALRMSTRTWEDPQPWAIVAALMDAYTRWMPLTHEEAEAMPDLLRLRTIIPTLWWLGRFPETGDGAIIVRGMGFLRRLDAWLKGYGPALVEVLGVWVR